MSTPIVAPLGVAVSTPGIIFFVLVSKNLAFHRKVSPEHDYWDIS